MIQIPTFADHLPLALALARDGKDLTEYHRLMDTFDEQFNALMSTVQKATEILTALATEDA